MLVHRRVTPSIKFAGTHLYTWVERGTVRVKCLAQEHNTTSPARARTRTARSVDERTNHEATAPPTEPVQGARQFGWASCLALAGRVTLASGTTFLHINALAPLTGTALCVARVTQCLDFIKAVKINSAKPTDRMTEGTSK